MQSQVDEQEKIDKSTQDKGRAVSRVAGVYFMETERIGFSKWEKEDMPLARRLWGNPEVAHYISANGTFSAQEIEARLRTEIENDGKYGIQYWPLFELGTGAFIGCCGFRPCGGKRDILEMGFHLCPEFWGKGYAQEAAEAAVRYAFSKLGVSALQAGHHPDNKSSKRLIKKLGFQFKEDCFYEPTGLYHPTYLLSQ